MLSKEMSNGVALTELSLLQYFARAFPGRGEWLMLLVQSLEMRSLALVLDGIDEAAGMRDSIGNLVHQRLAPMGHRVVATSRPSGVEQDVALSRYSRFVVVHLLPLSERQQSAAVSQQMHGHRNSAELGERMLALSSARHTHSAPEARQRSPSLSLSLPPSRAHSAECDRESAYYSFPPNHPRRATQINYSSRSPAPPRCE